MAKAERLALVVVLWILVHWPRWGQAALVSSLASLSSRFAKKDSKQLDANIHAIYRLPPHSDFARMFKRQVWRHQMACAIETLQAIARPERLQVDGYDELQKNIADAEAKNKGHLIVTAHLGSWELVAYYGAKAANRPFHVLAKPARRKSVTDLLNQLREKMGVEVFWTDRKSLLRDMLTSLRAAESVGFVMDQKPEGRVGPIVDFFSRPTEFVSGPATMALKTGADVIAVFCVRQGPFHFRLISKRIEPRTDDVMFTQDMASEIERVIRLYPEQWTWTYKRWRDVKA